MLSSKNPTVSVIIPAFNEEHYIEEVISSFKNSTYDNITEIIIGDGRSTDRTREIVEQLSVDDPRIKLVDNPDRIQSAALNRMVPIATGEVILRADAHCIYDRHYVEACINIMAETGAACVGGAQRFIARNRVQAGISLAVRTLFGSGNARYRDEQYSGYADTVFLGCYHKSVFEKAGLFSTNVLVNEDTEMAIRIRTHFENGIYISDTIKVWYFPRNTYKTLFIQYFRYGISRVKTRKLHGGKTGMRASIPFLTLLLIVIGFITELLVTGNADITSSIVALITVLTLLVSAKAAFETRNEFSQQIWATEAPPPGLASRILHSFCAIIVLNTAHAIGYGAQLFFRVR